MKEYLRRIIDVGSREDMECLGEIFIELLEKLKQTDEMQFKRYKNKIKGMAYNYEIDEELAKEIVSEMIPLGEEWDMETVRSATIESPHSLNDLYVVMNSLANDYSEIIPITEVATYTRMTNAWLEDPDAPSHKVWWYFIKKD